MSTIFINYCYSSFQYSQDNNQFSFEANMNSPYTLEYTTFVQNMINKMKREGILPKDQVSIHKMAYEANRIFYELMIKKIKQKSSSSQSQGIWEVEPNSEVFNLRLDNQRVIRQQNVNFLSNIREVHSQIIPENSAIFEEKIEVAHQVCQQKYSNEKRNREISQMYEHKPQLLFSGFPAKQMKLVQKHKKQEEVNIVEEKVAQVFDEPLQEGNRIPNSRLSLNLQVTNKRQKPKDEQPDPEASKPYKCQII